MANNTESNTHNPRSLTSPRVVSEITQGLKEINSSLNSIRDGFPSVAVDLSSFKDKDAQPLQEEWGSLKGVSKHPELLRIYHY